MIFLDKGGARNLPSGSDQRMRSDSSKGSQESAWVPTRPVQVCKKAQKNRSVPIFFFIFITILSLEAFLQRGTIQSYSDLHFAT